MSAPRSLRFLLAVAAATVASHAHASASASASATASPGPDITRALFALAVVLVLLLACAWIARRFGFTSRTGAHAPVKVVSSLSVGPRERILTLQVEDTWLVVGVTSGGMQTLHTLPAGKVDAQMPPAPSDWRAHLASALHQRTLRGARFSRTTAASNAEPRQDTKDA